MGDQHARCWARSLGDCAGPMTGEHMISRSQFDGSSITVRGFSWCKDEPRKVGIGSLVANVLCQRHNNALSPVDEAAKITMQAIREIGDRTIAAREGGPRLPRRTFRVSGDDLERWLLKTTINLALRSEPVPKAGIFDETGNPSRRYVEIAFGRAEFEVAQGLMWVAQVGEQIPLAGLGTIEFESWLRREDGALVAAFVSFHGNRLWLAADGAPPIEHGVHPIRVFEKPDVDVRIEFSWSKGRERQLGSQRAPWNSS